jgi:hypothetical protein
MMMHPWRWSREGRFDACTMDVAHYIEDVSLDDEHLDSLMTWHTIKHLPTPPRPWTLH